MSPLKNRYFLLRHGQSKSNVDQIIVSHPENGIKKEYTLTLKGENQVRKSIRKAIDDGMLDSGIIIYSSPFSRCIKTAEIAKEVLGVTSEILLDDRLREREFGSLEGCHSSMFQKVHEKDFVDNEHKEWNIESVKELTIRMLSLIKYLELWHFNRKILLVSHGDPLLMLQLHFLGKSFGQKEMPKNAELRELSLL